MRLPLAAEAFDRRFGTAQATLTNQYSEESREGPTESRRVDRPGLAPLTTLAPGPIRCILFHRGYRFVVSGTRVYRDNLQVGVIPGLQMVRHAQSDFELVLVAEGIAYLVDAAVAPIAMPDGDLISDVGFAGGRFVYSVKDTGKYRYAEIGDATDIGDLNFASAESDPDPIRSIEVLGDDLLFLGAKTTEWHSPTGDIDAPFVRNGGRRYDKGSAAQNTAVKLDNTILWVGTAQQGADLQVYRASQIPVAVSNEGIEAALARCPDISLATAVAIVSTGHSFYVLNIPQVGTYAFDVKTGLWGEWQSFGQQTFRVQCGADGVFGDIDTGQLWTIDPDRRTDGDDPIIRVVSSNLSLEENSMIISAVRLHARTGVGGPGENPVVEMRYARHGAEDWSGWRETAIGAPGDHPEIVFRQLGLQRPPGIVFQFRCSGDFDFVPYAVTINGQQGGQRI